MRIPTETELRQAFERLGRSYIELLSACGVRLEGQVRDQLFTAIRHYHVRDQRGELVVNPADAENALAQLHVAIAITRNQFGLGKNPGSV